MSVLYIDSVSGISGNMMIGALLDLGLDFEYLKTELEKLNVDGYELVYEKRDKNGIMATYFNVKLDGEEDSNHSHEHHHEHSHGDEHHHHEHSHEHHHEHEHSHVHRNLEDIHAILNASSLSENVKTLSKEIFQYIAVAEAKIHGKELNEVHFHEVGAIDSIVDIVGTAILLEALDVEEVISSPLHTGTGFINIAHGLFPVPVPATLEILAMKEIPTYSKGIESELVTPTGAAIVATIANGFGERPSGAVERVGYGAGSKDLNIPNVLRLVLVKKNSRRGIYKLEFNVDDMTGEELGFLMEKLLAENALDVYYTPIQMKKNRPGTMVSVLCNAVDRNVLIHSCFAHSTTLGIRISKVSRVTMKRSSEVIETEYGEVNRKSAEYEDISRSSYEYEDIKRIALAEELSLREVVEKINI